MLLSIVNSRVCSKLSKRFSNACRDSVQYLSIWKTLDFYCEDMYTRWPSTAMNAHRYKQLLVPGKAVRRKEVVVPIIQDSTCIQSTK